MLEFAAPKLDTLTPFATDTFGVLPIATGVLIATGVVVETLSAPPLIVLTKVDKLPFSLSDVMLVLFLHDIEKPLKYGSKYKLDISNEEIRKSLISEYEIELSSVHISALKYIHGEGNDYSPTKRMMNPLSAFCHCCDIISARIFFDRKK